MLFLLLVFFILFNGILSFPCNRFLTLRNRMSLNLAQSTVNDIPKSFEITNFTGPGCTLIINSGDYDHYLMKEAVFIFNHNEKGTQGVIVAKQSAFTMGEVSPSIEPFQANTLYMGGNSGPDMAMIFHTYDLPGSKYVGSGIYLGGIRQAQEMVKEGKASPKDFKFFFNTIDWEPGTLEKEIEQGRWGVVKVPPSYILGPASEDLWNKANNLIISKSAAMNTRNN